jgi:hypothetical protein
MGERRPLADSDIAVLGLVDGGIIRGMRDIDHQGGVRFQTVGDLARSQATHFLHDVGNGQHFGFQTFALAVQVAKGFGNRECAHPVVEGPRHGQVIAQHFESFVQGDGIADADEGFGFTAAAGANVDEEIVYLGHLAFVIGFG